MIPRVPSLASQRVPALARVLSCAVLFALLVPMIAPTFAQTESETPSPRTVQVSGEGTARATPDRAVVRFGIVTVAQEAEAAREQNAAAAKQAMNAVRDLDVPENKMRMETLQIQPQREWNPQERTYEEKGFEANRQVVVELDDLDVLPTLVTRVVQGGANRLNGIEYELSNRDAVRNEALRNAAEASRAKADLLAQTLGAELGAVHTIQEQNFNFPRPVFSAQMERAKMADAAPPEPDAYAAGEIEVTATVSVTFLLQ